MALKCGIVGLTNIGKTTIFNCFSDTKAQVTNYSFSTSKSNIGMAFVPDSRLNVLDKTKKTEKIIPTTVDFVDIPGLAKGSGSGEGIGNSFLNDVRNVDALIHVIRCFEDENIQHTEGSIDPVRDIEILNFELQLKDLESVTKKIAKLQKLIKIGDKDARKAKEIMLVYKEHIENFENASTAPVSEDDKAYVKELALLTMKPFLYVCNVDDDSASTGNKYSKAVEESLKDTGAEVITIAAQLEAEITELDKEDQKDFLDDAGLTEPGVNKLIHSAYSLLNLQTFFTVGPKEIRAWTIKKGMSAPEAAGVIHSDLKRGFIRAEVMKYDDYTTLGSEQACKENGKFKVEGKNYIVAEGDIMHIRFNV